MKILLSLILSFLFSYNSWAYLTEGYIPVVKTSSSSGVASTNQNSECQDSGTVVTCSGQLNIPQICLNGVCEVAWPSGGSQTTGSSILAGNGSGGFTNVTLSGLTYTTGTLSVNANPYVKVSNTQTSGTGGGSATSGSWSIYPFNTKDIDTGNIASLSTNVVTLPAGTYLVKGKFTFSGTGNSSTRLYNVTGSAVLFYGTGLQTTSSLNFYSFIDGIITLGVSSGVRVEYQINNSADFGVANSYGPEVYAVLEFIKIG